MGKLSTDHGRVWSTNLVNILKHCRDRPTIRTRLPPNTYRMRHCAGFQTGFRDMEERCADGLAGVVQGLNLGALKEGDISFSSGRVYRPAGEVAVSRTTGIIFPA